MQGTLLYQGTPQGFDPAYVSRQLQQPEVLIEVGLAAGDAVAEAWGCDLSADYVRINADYTT